MKIEAFFYKMNIQNRPKILIDIFNAAMHYKQLAENGKLKDYEYQQSLANFDLEPFDSFIEKLKCQSPVLTKNQFFDSRFTKAIRITNKANIMIRKYNEDLDNLIKNHTLYPEIKNTLSQIGVFSEVAEGTIWFNNFKFGNITIDIFFNMLYENIDCSIIKLKDGEYWSAGYEGRAGMFDASCSYSKPNPNSSLNDLEAVITKWSNTIDRLVQECNYLSSMFLIGEYHPDFQFLLNCDDLGIQIEKQRLRLTENLDKILTDYNTLLKYILYFLEIHEFPKI